MSIQDNFKILRDYYDMFNKKDFNRGKNLVDDNAEFQVIPFNMKLSGKEGYLQVVQGWTNAFPDGLCDITNIIAGEDGAVVEFIGRGTQTGKLVSPEGEIMPTGKHVDVPFCDVIRIKNGKITSLNSYFDTATMMKQLGIIPELKHQ
ncbi:MAG: ester cyclase [Ignavibacteria bacterium]